MQWFKALAGVLSAYAAVAASASHLLPANTIGQVAEFDRLDRKHSARENTGSSFRTITVPVDHFKNDSRYEPFVNDTFELRYTVDASHWKPGGPVIVTLGGEGGDSDDEFSPSPGGRSSQTYFPHALAEDLNALFIHQGHRFYGGGYPLGNDFTTSALRVLTAEQAMADTAFLAQHITIDEYPDANLTAPEVPWILYGGSYTGALAAFTRMVYPDLFLGAISSSGVTQASDVLPEYWNAFSNMFPECATQVSLFTLFIDNILTVRLPNTPSFQ